MKLQGIAVRALSGAIYVGIIVASIYLGDIAMYCLASIFGLLATVEFYRITHSEDRHRGLLSLFLDLGCILSLTWMTLGMPIILFMVFLLARLTSELYSGSDRPLRNLSLSLMSMLWIGLPLGLMLFIPFMRYSTLPLLVIFIMIWLNDTGAYLVGSAIGRHKLFERISPKKSWEGFFGGLAFNLIAAALFGTLCPSYFHLDLGIGFWLGLGVLVTLFSTWGDLFESLIKRNLKIKDSGNLIPGHGGILDRIDSLLFVMPACALYILIFELSDLGKVLSMF